MPYTSEERKKQVGELERKISKGAPQRHSRISSLCVYARVLFVYKLSENKGEAEESCGEREGRGVWRMSDTQTGF